MGIAAVKACLVVFFMDLRYASSAPRVVAATTGVAFDVALR
jgi:hypothetical protein